MTNTHITRRTVLAAGATAVSTAMLVTSPALAAVTKPASRCSTLHPLIGQNLAMYCDDANVSDIEKNCALKAAHCPQCAVQITPFGGSVGYVRLSI